ncbi:MAG: phospholipase D-like domain-containing protein, partial [Myxococcota bacterium]
IDKLIAKAEAGVQVVALFEPPSKEGNTKYELLQRLQEAGARTGKIFVGVSSRQTKDQIMHVKRAIADTAGDSMAEVSGGINFGQRAGLNVDSAWRIEGVGVLDSLRDLLLHYPDSHAIPFDLSMIPRAEHLEEVAKKRIAASGAEHVEIESARCGLRTLGAPHSYTKKKFLRRASRGAKLVVNAADLGKPWVPSALHTAVQNGSMVKIIVPNGTRDEITACRRAIGKHEELLERLGLGVQHEGMLVGDDSYLSLVLRELDAAIEAKETIDVAAFGLSEPEILERLVMAHEAGCKVRVTVDDTYMRGGLLNQRAIATLTAAGIEVKVFTDDIATKMNLARNDEHDIKLHAKLIVIGGNRVLGGSANFTKQGMNENIEDGKLVRSTAVAKLFTENLFEPVWKHALEPTPMRFVSHGRRTLAFPPYPHDATIKDSVFLVYDVETTGWEAEHDERILSVSAVAMRQKADGT